MKQNTKITVIGAGLAGLTSAYRLKQQGFKVELFEARGRPGGRVFTANICGSKEELGGKYLFDNITGGGGSLLFKLVEEMGLKTKPSFFGAFKSCFSKGKVDSFYGLVKEGPAPSPDNFSKLTEIVKESKNLKEVFNRFFFGKEKLRTFIEMFMSGYEGSSSEKLSAHYATSSFWNTYTGFYEEALKYANDEAIEEYLPMVEGGNSLFIKAVANELQGDIHYQHPLRKISRGPKGTFILHFDRDKTAIADCLVLALPSSTLRDVKIEEGMIPADQKHAIDTQQYGTNAKILLPIKLQGESYVTFSEQSIAWINDSCSIMTLNYGAENGHFNSSSIRTLSHIIQNELKSLKKLYPEVEWIGGDEVSLLKEDLDAHYTNAVGISWAYEEFSKGSYSNFAPDQYDLFHQTSHHLGEKVRHVFRPIQNKIFFAGEHTAIDFPAMMEGAVESGEKAARMISRI